MFLKQKNNTYKLILKLLPALILSALAAYSATFDSLTNAPSFSSPFKILIAIAVFGGMLFFVVQLLFKGNQYPSAMALSILFALFTVGGRSYNELGNWDMLVNPKAPLLLLGYGAMFYLPLKYLFERIDCQKAPSLNRNSQRLSPSAEFVENHLQLTAFVLIVLCWIPWIVIYYPGAVSWDGYSQLNNYFGISEPNNHHPYFSTLIIGFIMSLGRGINDNFGVFCFILVQLLFCAAVYSLVCKKIRIMGAGRWAYFAALAFYALVPMWPAYSVSLIKDTLFCSFAALFVILSAEIIKNRERVSFKKLLAFVLIALFICFFRNNGIYMILPAGAAIALALRGAVNRLKVSGAVALVLSLYLLWNTVLLPLMGVAQGSSREALSIPFQQTARFVVEHPDEVTEEEKRIIDEVLDYERLPELYNPQLSDPVKFSRSTAPTTDYIKVWAQMFLRRPDCYIQASLHSIYGYFYPFESDYAQWGYHTWMQGPPLATGDLDIHFTQNRETINLMNKYSSAWREIPVLDLLSSVGSHAWILLTLIVLMLRKKRFAELSVMVLPLMNIAACVASPVNGLLRYAMPLIACIPFLIAYCSTSLSCSTLEQS